MLFFFELALFVLIMVTLALGEFVSRGLALWVWGVATVVSLGGYVVSRARLRPPPSLPGREGIMDSIEDKWARTLLYNWRRTNALLIVGLAVVGGWYWLAY